MSYAGIETKHIREFVAASAKNHRRKQYKLGEVQKALAKKEGSNDIVYEVIYVEVIDPKSLQTVQEQLKVLVFQQRIKLLLTVYNML